MRYKTLLVSGLLVSFAAAAASDDTTYLPGKSYDQDGARWSDRLARRKPGPGFCPKELKDKCSLDSLVIRNESAQDIRCETHLGYPQPNKANIQDLDSVEVIKAGTERQTVQALNVPLALELKEFSSRCKPLPDLAPLTTPAECKAKFVRAPNPGDFYPPGSVMKNEQGTVVVEFTLAGSGVSPTDAVVVRSSEHPDLDEAALRFMAQSTLDTACVGQRFRKTIPFKLADE